MRDVARFAVTISLAGGAAALLLVRSVVAQPDAAQPAASPAHHNSCFYVSEFQNWRAADAKTVYIRTTGNHFYRLDMSGECYDLMQPDAHLVMNIHGPDTICSAVDWSLKVGTSGPGGFATPCIVKTMTELTPAEADAIPKHFKP